jgi:hypothetical protein
MPSILIEITRHIPQSSQVNRGIEPHLGTTASKILPSLPIVLPLAATKPVILTASKSKQKKFQNGFQLWHTIKFFFALNSDTKKL